MVLVFTTVLALLSGSLVNYLLTERRLNHGNALRFEAKNAAEAVLEYAASEMRARLSRNLNFSTQEFNDTPIDVHGDRLAELFASSAAQPTRVDPAAIGLWVSQVTEPTRRFVDPTNPANDYDPLRGQTVTVQSVRFLARARAGDPTRTAVVHATQSIEIRDAAMFNYAIFYNLDLEFHPSPSMTVVGPVHSNDNVYLTENNSLSLRDVFTTAGTLTIGTKGAGRPSGRNIHFTTGVDDNSDGHIDLVSVNNPTVAGTALGTWVDSAVHTRKAGQNFRDLASQIWNGYLQDSSHGIARQTPPGVLTGAQAHALITPPLPAAHASYDATIEAQKFSNKAGLYFLVEPGGNTLAFTRAEHALAYKSAGAVGSPARTNWRGLNPEAVVQTPAGLVENQRRVYDHREGRWVNTIDIDLGVMRTAVLATTADAAVNFKVDGNDWPIDDADHGWNGTVYVEVENPLAGYTSAGLSYQSNATTTVNQGAGSGTRTAVRLLNGGQLPNRRAANPSDAFLPEGLTLATNAAVYVAGHYNADGTLAADLSDMTTPEAAEVPAAIVGDAVNILSQAWVTTEHDTGRVVPAADLGSNDSTRPAAAHTEFSAALLTGIVTTAGAASNQYSGGVENYPRFHENWSNRSLRYRGSIVALFESQVATRAWTHAKYGAPRREWGFNAMFGSQRRYPPGTPIIRTFRRVDYRDLGQAEFDTLVDDADLNFTAM